MLCAAALTLAAQPRIIIQPMPPGTGAGTGPGQGGGAGAGGRNWSRNGTTGAQQAQGPPGSVRGTVVGAGGEPLRKADVILQSLTGSAMSFTTDESGTFSFEGVAPDSYLISAQRNGYVRHDPSRGSGRMAAPIIVVSPGQDVTGVSIKMTPHSVITGKVVDEDGDPVARSTVQVMRERWQRGQRQLLPVHNGNTNDLGEYRVAGLAAGKYYLTVNASRGFEGNIRQRSRAGAGVSESGYLMTFYPGVTDPAQATPFEIGAGQEARGIDFQLRKVTTYRIRGRVVDPAGTPLNNVGITLLPADVSFGMSPRTGGAVRNDDGSFELGGVAPGSYTLVANQMARGSGRTTSMLPVQVGNSDVENVVLTLAPPVDVSGIVRSEGDGKVDVSRVRVMFESTLGVPMFSGGPSRPANADGTFVAQGITPGKYRVNVSGLPEGTYLKAVRVGPQDVLDSGFAITGAGTTVEVILGTKAPSVTGKVQDSNGKPVAAAAILLAPEGPGRANYNRWLTATSSEDGSFALKNIAPGEYKVIAFPESEAESVYNPALVRQNESRGTTLKLSEGVQETVQLIL